MDTYRKVKILGSGTHSDAYLYMKDDKKYTIKRYIRGIGDDGIAIEILREISVMKRLKHDNIVGIGDVIVQNERISIVYDHMNTNLRSYLHNSVSNIDNTRLIVYQLLKGLAYMQHNNVIHRDIKPDNILMNDPSDVKIADFSISRRVSSLPTAYTQNMQTLYYRSPEILMGSDTYTNAIDIWSIACILYELHTRRILFQGVSEIGQLYDIFKMLGTPNKSIYPDIDKLKYYSPKFPVFNGNRLYKDIKDDQLVDLLDRMLIYDPSKRISALEAMNHPFFRLIHTSYVPPYTPNIPPITNEVYSYGNDRNSLFLWIKSLLPSSNRRFFHAITLIDMFLSKQKIDKGSLELLALSCLLIASKLNDIVPLDIKDISNTHPLEYIRKMELLVLKTLNFNVDVITPYNYAESYTY